MRKKKLKANKKLAFHTHRRTGRTGCRPQRDAREARFRALVVVVVLPAASHVNNGGCLRPGLAENWSADRSRLSGADSTGQRPSLVSAASAAAAAHSSCCCCSDSGTRSFSASAPPPCPRRPDCGSSDHRNGLVRSHTPRNRREKRAKHNSIEHEKTRLRAETSAGAMHGESFMSNIASKQL